MTVSLSGDGGDELFAGYQTYAWMRSPLPGPRRFPRPARLCLAGLLRLLPATVWESLLPGREVGQRLHRLAEVLSARDQEEMYLRLISHWREPERLVGMAEPPTHFTSPRPGPVSEQILTRIMFLDGVTYLPDDILTKLDRASMAVALEGRVPLLDHRVVEFSWSLPLSLKVREGKPKWPLRQVLFRHVPHALVERPKHGFAVPLGEWLRGPLRPWAEEHLSPARLREEGVLAPDLVARRWAEHLAGGRNWQYSLWNVLMFQLWHQASPASRPAEETAMSIPPFLRPGEKLAAITLDLEDRLRRPGGEPSTCATGGRKSPSWPGSWPRGGRRSRSSSAPTCWPTTPRPNGSWPGWGPTAIATPTATTPAPSTAPTRSPPATRPSPASSARSPWATAPPRGC